jgi:2'-5' RNA ligase
MDTELEKFRLFVAVRLPESVKSELSRAQAELRDALPPGAVRWTKPEQCHLTLKFLGDVDAPRVGELCSSIRKACHGFPAVHLRAERIGFFPHPRHPRVIWAWVHDLAECLPLLQQAVDVVVEDFTDEIREKTFTGHVTLGRCRNIKRAEAEILSNLAMRMADRVFGEWTADRIELIRSELSPGGSRHSSLATIELAGESSSASV